MNRYEQIVDQLIEAQKCASDSERAVEPLDDTIAAHQRFIELQMEAFAEHLRSGKIEWGTPIHLNGHIARWRQSVDTDGLTAVCGAVAGLIRQVLLAARHNGEEQGGRLEALRESPNLEVFAPWRSQLGEDNNLTASARICIGTGTFTSEISQQCQIPPVQAEVAWRAIGASLRDFTDVLPFIELEDSNDGALEVSVRSTLAPSDYSATT
jgi:hypothetical protein